MKRLARALSAALVLSAAAAPLAPQRERESIPKELQTPPGLDQVKPLLDHAESPPSQPPRLRADRMPAIAAPDEPVAPLTNELFADPPARYRPWTRWWWLGNRVDEAESRRQVAMFVEKGFGGVEIQAFSLGDRVDRRPG
ncbi:MAG TPA: hypothetical protein VHR17_16340, partial [Thermoanaerobaculia bacterium]|nr:hypothetical protein [Thermoanaerobaculia bacterium]